jgi:hypothetical protein
MAFCEKDKVWWEAAPAAQFHSGSSSDQKHSGACRGEEFVLGQDVPDGFGELAGDVDPGDLRAALPAQVNRPGFETPIRNHLRASDAMYDPFLGSGTALVAAERTGVRCYAMEIDPVCVEVALRRWELFSGATAERVDQPGDAP